MPLGYASGETNLNLRIAKNVVVSCDELESHPDCIPALLPVFPGLTPDPLLPWPEHEWMNSLFYPFATIAWYPQSCD